MRCIPGKDCSDYKNYESMKSFVPSAENGGQAEMTVDEILDAVVPHSHVGHPHGKPGLSLDHTSAACPEKCRNYETGKYEYSTRYKGIIIMAELQYDNTGLIIEDSHEGNVMYNLRF